MDSGSGQSVPVPASYQYYMTGLPYTNVLLELHKCVPGLS